MSSTENSEVAAAEVAVEEKEAKEIKAKKRPSAEMENSKKRSNVWLRFTPVDSNRAKCDICQAILSHKGGTTSNLLKHLMKKHPRFFVGDINRRAKLHADGVGGDKDDSSINNPILSTSKNPIPSTSNNPIPSTSNNPIPSTSNNPIPSTSNNPIPSTSNNPIPLTSQHPATDSRLTQSSTVQQKLDRLVLQMIVKDFQPFSIVEDVGFQNLINELDNSYKLPSRKMLSKELLPAYYNEVAENVKNKLSDAEYICLTTDTWTSCAMDSYMCITAHFVSSKWELCTVVLDCCKLEERHTAEVLKTYLLKAADDWGIKNKITTVVSDNAANIVAAVKLASWYSWGCTAHTLNLIVQDAIKIIKNVQIKVKAIVEYFHRSTVAADKLKNMQIQLFPNAKPIKLKMDVITRWNSTFDMFQRIIKIREPLEATLGVLKNPVAVLDAKEWALLKECSEILEPFKKIIDELSSEKNVSISKVIIIIQGLRKYLTNVSGKIHEETGREFIDKIRAGINEKFPKIQYNPVLTRPTFLDPRFKAKAFDDSVAFESVKENVISSVGRFIATSTEICAASTTPSDDDLIWGYFDKKVEHEKDTQLSASIIEVSQYLSERYLERKEDPLRWWKARENIYPGLAKLAKSHLCISATSVPSERIFSKAGQIISEWRSRLKSHNVKKMIFLNVNA